MSLIAARSRLSEQTTGGLAKHLCDLGVPFIVCSGTAGVGELATIFQNATFLAKPFSSDALISAVLRAEGPQS